MSEHLYSPDDDRRANDIERIVNTIVVAENPVATCALYADKLHALLEGMNSATRDVFIDDLRGGGDVLPEEPSRIPAPVDIIFDEFAGTPLSPDEPGVIGEDLRRFRPDLDAQNHKNN